MVILRYFFEVKFLYSLKHFPEPNLLKSQYNVIRYISHIKVYTLRADDPHLPMTKGRLVVTENLSVGRYVFDKNIPEGRSFMAAFKGKMRPTL